MQQKKKIIDLDVVTLSKSGSIIYTQGKPNLLANSSELNTVTLSCSLNAASSDQIAQFNFSANAKNSLSLMCGETSLASGSLSEYLSSENVFTLPLTSENDNSKSSLGNLDSLKNSQRIFGVPKISGRFFRILQISFQCLPISNSSQSGLTGFISSQNSISCLAPLEISEEIIGLESTTNNSIYINPLFLSSPSLSSLILLPNSSANFSASSFDNLLLEVKDFSSSSFSLFDLSNSSSNDFSSIDLAINSGQLNSGDSFNSSFNSSGISIFSSAILLSQNAYERTNYLNFSSDIIKNCNFGIVIKESSCQREQSSLLSKNGNVGIGTTGPGSKLHVADTNTLITSDSSANLRVMTTDAQAINLGGSIGLGGMRDDGAVLPYIFAAIHGKKANSVTSDTSGYFAISTRDDTDGTTVSSLVD